MNKFVIALAAALAIVGLAACDKKSGDKFVTGANSCFNYNYNHYGNQYGNQYGNAYGGSGYYTDQYGRQVPCNQGQFSGLNNYVPYNNMIGGQMIGGCSIWSQWYPGSFYTPVNIQGFGWVCVKQNYMMQLPGFQTYQTQYGGGFPTYAQSCQYGANCGGCYNGGRGGANVSAGMMNGNFWLGGTLGLCWQ